jgi:hypothetical protein
VQSEETLNHWTHLFWNFSFLHGPLCTY